MCSQGRELIALCEEWMQEDECGGDNNEKEEEEEGNEAPLLDGQLPWGASRRSPPTSTSDGARSVNEEAIHQEPCTSPTRGATASSFHVLYRCYTCCVHGRIVTSVPRGRPR